ncbi:MAG: sulfotransferase family protein [Candidatus Limnocylindria bacterium]
MTGRRPDFFIVGAPKSGTTAMYQYLRAHPDLYLPERKELRFFGQDLEIRDRRTLTPQEYLAHFVPARQGQLIGTAYVWYLYSKSAAQEIATYAPDARIIAMLRNPTDMLHALHGEHLSNGNEDIRDFTAALEAESDRQARRRIPPHAHLPQGLLYSTVPRYTEQLERYVRAFGRERVHVIIHDDLAADTGGVYRDLLRFLAVRDDVRPATFDIVNASKKTRSEWLRHLLARPPELPRRIIRAVVPPAVRRRAYRRAQSANIAAAPREPMSAATRHRLRALFGEEVERLSGFLGRDLSAWSNDPGQRPSSIPAVESPLTDGE